MELNLRRLQQKKVLEKNLLYPLSAVKEKRKFGFSQLCQPVLTAKRDTMFLSLSEEGGITIESDQKIEIKSGGDINIKGKKIKITAQDEITMEAGESNVVMDNITHLKGKKIKQSGTLKR